MELAIIGIDGSVSGALVCIDESEKLHAVHDSPYLMVGKSKRDFDPSEMCRTLTNLVARCGAPTPVFVFLENSRTMGNKLGSHAQYLRGASKVGWSVACASITQHKIANVKLEYVMPGEWQSKMLIGASGGDTKQRSLNKASAMFPELPLVKPGGRVPTLDGRSDAALIAVYGLRYRLCEMRADKN